jgi:hypothetical protein
MFVAKVNAFEDNHEIESTRPGFDAYRPDD